MGLLEINVCNGFGETRGDVPPGRALHHQPDNAWVARQLSCLGLLGARLVVMQLSVAW